MRKQEFETFEEFWLQYVREHQSPTTRKLHFLGTSVALGLAAYGAARRKPWALVAAPCAGYAFAWLSHFMVEKNQPTTHSHPWMSLRANLRMWGKTVRGTMDAVVAEVQAADVRNKPSAATQKMPATNVPASGGAGSYVS
jgi:hypothetical protein